MSKYADIVLDRPFRIKNKDSTVWLKSEYGLKIYFHAENFWCNPPTDSSIEWRAIKQIEKHGVEMLPDDYVEQYNAHGRAKDMERAMERHREQMWKNRHLHPWLRKPTKDTN